MPFSELASFHITIFVFKLTDFESCILFTQTKDVLNITFVSTSINTFSHARIWSWKIVHLVWIKIDITLQWFPVSLRGQRIMYEDDHVYTFVIIWLYTPNFKSMQILNVLKTLYNLKSLLSLHPKLEVSSEIPLRYFTFLFFAKASVAAKF